MNKNLFKIVFAALVLFIIINNIFFYPQNILSWDIFGYYLYLPFKFIYHNLSLSDDSIVYSIIAKYHNTDTFYQASKMPDGQYVMKYTMGLSFFYAPFFFIGHAIAYVFGYTCDGFSAPYQYAIFVGGMLYSIIGIWALLKVLFHFFSANIAAIVAFCIVFATNYIVHICMYGQNAMSQNFLFTTYALLVWLSILWHQTHKTKHALLLAVICGITILSRPSEIICLMIPVLWGVKSIASLIEKTKHLLKHKWQLIAFAFIIIAFGMMQFGYWKLFAGKFLFNSYGGNAGEGFEFKHPYIWEVLFSFRKGWLLYTPIMLFALAGFYFMYKQNRSIFYALFVYLILNIYIVSSWSCWWYAQSFSQRALIPSYPIMAIALGYFLTWISQQKTITKLIAYVAISVCVILNIFQTIQFHKGIISGDSMTKAYYCATFGKLSTDANLKKLLLVNRLFGGREVFSNKNDYSLRMFKKFDFEDVQNHDSTFYRSGRFAAKLDSINIYTPAVEAPYCEITEKDHAWIRITAYVYPTNDTLSAPFSLVVYFDHNNYAYKYFTYDSRMMKLELNKWNKIVFDYLSPEVRNKNDKLMLYFWNRGKGNVYIDDMQVEIFEEK